ncbi:MAG: hypothetical protein DCF19_04435 [Pseudanabaena frigida]|uniref:DUF2281 domain-containing protein n=1 Tax=Pseudanabaena frigida TaxID=945775 RepID=A0A2W4Y8X0_9CYAN|nr:MAG: hypothetical protein DCF19_04435 [Pseudanabaena frigida]
MTTLEIAIAKIKKLPAEQRNEVIRFIEFLEFKVGKPSDNQEQIETDKKELSFAEVAKDFIGCLDSNLEDLSYNPKYMEGFGK